MTTFSSQWLALRESADHRARNLALQTQVLAYLNMIASMSAEPVRLIDLGSGTGSNLRALAPHLPKTQHWTLVDYDLTLLNTARLALIAWADQEIIADKKNDSNKTISSIDSLIVMKGHQQIEIEFLCTDLAKNIESVMALPADMVTAAAFFDLVAEDWLIRFCKALSKPLYTVLSYNGIESWSPPQANDSKILKAFHTHQRTDKGFGVAVGPDAIDVMQQLLKQRNFKTVRAESPWILDSQDRLLMESLASGSAAAILETGLVEPAVVNQWRESRIHAIACEIGHTDFFAYKEN